MSGGVDVRRRDLPAPGAALAALATIGIGLAGCAVGREHRVPELAAPAAWSAPEQAGAVELARWWSAYRAPLLDELVDEALRANLDLRLAAARLREARAAVGGARSAHGPQVDATGSFTRQRSSENSLIGRFGAGTYDTWQAGFDAAWEIDLFGGTRRAVEAAVADLGASEAAAAAVRVSVAAEVARTWAAWAAAHERLAWAKAAAANQRTSRDLAAARARAGLVNEALMAQADAQLALAESLVPQYAAEATAQGDRMALLLGRRPDAMGAFSARLARLSDPADPLRLGLPSELLRRRPDIAQAERQLAAATARHGVAVADWFPRFSLLGSFGYQAMEGGDLLDGASRFWSVGPSIRWPILSWGRIRSRVEAADARAEQAAIRYEQIVLQAFAEVEESLVRVLNGRERSARLGEAMRRQEQAVALSRERFEKGLSDYGAVLTDERLLLDYQDRLIGARLAQAQDLAALAKALGGGWADAGAAAR